MRQRTEQEIRFVNVNLVPMTGPEIVAGQAVLIQGKRIVEIGPWDATEIGADEIVVDGKGAYLMPGLADMHMHTCDEWEGELWPVSPLNLYLASGVTTIRDLGPQGQDPSYVLRWRDEIKNGSRPGPTIYSAGPIIDGLVLDPEGTVRRQHEQGFDLIKLYSFLSKDEFLAAMTTAKQIGMHTAGHIPFAVGLDGVLAAGMDEIAHIEELDFELMDFSRDARLTPDEWFAYIMKQAALQYGLSEGIDFEKLKAKVDLVLPAMVEKLARLRTPVCTTMVVGSTIVSKLFEPQAFMARTQNRYLPRPYLESFDKGEERHQRQFRGNESLAIFKRELERMILADLHQAGVTLLLSTDAGTDTMGLVPGISIHEELRILTENGFTPFEAIATGTINASRVIEKMTGKGDFGTIEVGKRADLLLVKGNPLEDVANIKALGGVMASGRWYPEDKLCMRKSTG